MIYTQPVRIHILSCTYDRYLVSYPSCYDGILGHIHDFVSMSWEVRSLLMRRCHDSKKCWLIWDDDKPFTTVDGRIPAPPGMYKAM